MIFYAGIAITLLGFLGILWFIQRVLSLRRRDDDDDTVQAELRALVTLNIGAAGLSFIGFTMAVVGLIIA